MQLSRFYWKWSEPGYKKNKKPKVDPLIPVKIRYRGIYCAILSFPPPPIPLRLLFPRRKTFLRGAGKFFKKFLTYKGAILKSFYPFFYEIFFLFSFFLAPVSFYLYSSFSFFFTSGHPPFPHHHHSILHNIYPWFEVDTNPSSLRLESGSLRLTRIWIKLKTGSSSKNGPTEKRYFGVTSVLSPLPGGVQYIAINLSSSHQSALYCILLYVPEVLTQFM